MASWFETRGVAALLTTRVSDLILRSRAAASRRMSGTSGATWFETALTRLLTMRNGLQRHELERIPVALDVAGIEMPADHQRRRVGEARE